MEESNFNIVSSENALVMKLAACKDKLVVIDFSSARCPPCQQAAPLFKELSNKYKKAIFIEVDIEVCPAYAQKYGVSATPTFVLIKNSAKIAAIRGANISSLEEKIKQNLLTEGQDDDCGVPGHIDLLSVINKNGCECLNEDDHHPHTNIFNSNPGTYLLSDADEQLILTLDFSETVKIHSLRIKGPTENGPKKVKLFVNQPFTLDFSSAEQGDGAATMELTPEQLKGDLIPLKFVKFQNVMGLNIFVENNQGDTDVTRMDYLQVIGSPMQRTNMAEFKRVSGKKGESH